VIVIRNELGDTGAGWRRPYGGARAEWECPAGHGLQPGYRSNCPECYAPAPGSKAPRHPEVEQR
jgi:hypothetical protein